MSLLLRRTRRAVWVGSARSREGAVKEFERTVEDTDGISVFEVETEADRLAVVAAVACARVKCSRIDLLEVERTEVERHGRVTPTPEKGTTPVRAANALHRSLDWKFAALRNLAEEVFDSAVEPREFDAATVRAAVRALDPDAVIGESAREFVRSERAKRMG